MPPAAAILMVLLEGERLRCPTASLASLCLMSEFPAPICRCYDDGSGTGQPLTQDAGLWDTCTCAHTNAGHWSTCLGQFRSASLTPGHVMQGISHKEQADEWRLACSACQWFGCRQGSLRGSFLQLGGAI